MYFAYFLLRAKVEGNRFFLPKEGETSRGGIQKGVLDAATMTAFVILLQIRVEKGRKVN